jgi:hypothetical protein
LSDHGQAGRNAPEALRVDGFDGGDLGRAWELKHWQPGRRQAAYGHSIRRAAAFCARDHLHPKQAVNSVEGWHRHTRIVICALLVSLRIFDAIACLSALGTGGDVQADRITRSFINGHA